MARQRLPVIVGFGGVNAAGRASGHHAYARMAYSALSAAQRERTLDALATLMGLDGGAQQGGAQHRRRATRTAHSRSHPDQAH